MRANKYKEIRPLLQSGDIVLFRGRGVISGLILLFCRLFSRFKKVQFSHIGMIVVDAGRVMLFESTTLYGGKGVQLKPLSEVLQIYKGGVFVRRLICERDERFYEILFKSVTELLGRPYEKNIIELMGAAAGIVQVFDGAKETAQATATKTKNITAANSRAET